MPSSPSANFVGFVVGVLDVLLIRLRCFLFAAALSLEYKMALKTYCDCSRAMKRKAIHLEALNSLIFQRRVREDFMNIIKIPLNPPLAKGELET
jgi:hypothetical protein